MKIRSFVNRISPVKLKGIMRSEKKGNLDYLRQSPAGPARWATVSRSALSDPFNNCYLYSSTKHFRRMFSTPSLIFENTMFLTLCERPSTTKSSLVYGTGNTMLCHSILCKVYPHNCLQQCDRRRGPRYHLASAGPDGFLGPSWAAGSCFRYWM